jgi:hypothetical protein
MTTTADTSLLPIEGDLRERTVRRLLNAMRTESFEQAIEEIVDSLPMPAEIVDVESECGPKIVAIRSIDHDTRIGAEISYLAGRPFAPTLTLLVDEADLSFIGSGHEGDFAAHDFGVHRPSALRGLADALIAIADAADARGVFWPLQVHLGERESKRQGDAKEASS